MSATPTPGPPAPLPCARCGYLADTSGGALNFCPKCGLDLRAGAAPAAPDPTTSLHLGQVVADRYRLTALLGEGGMGAVFRAEHVRMGKALAVKLLRGGFARDPAAVERFKTEAHLVSRLSHPHTIAVFDFGELPRDAGFYLAMEYVPGKDLATELRSAGRLPEPRAVAIVEQLLGSLAEAHEAGIVHRDVKPANVMLMATRDGDFVKVLDFGIAKLRGAGGSDATQGVIIGTPSYLAPEQARGAELDGRADLYSAGAMLYELVAGRCPFVNRNPVAVMQAHLNQEPPALRLIAPWVSDGLAAVIHRALRKRPEERFASADQMRRALLALQARPAPPRQPSPGDARLANRADFEEFERQVRRLRRSRVMAPTAVLAALALAAAAVWRWPDLYALAQRRVPAAARLLPEALRPASAFDGEEHEPNDTPALANPVPIPPGADGRPGGGVAVVRGFVGAKLDANTGDVDVYRVEVPDLGRRLVLVADWSGPEPGQGIRGLDVVLTLNRERPGEGGRRTAPLVAQANRGGPGRPERLEALVEPGRYFLAVRERHDEATGPVEKPTDPYQLRVTLAQPRPGHEVEPNDDPESVDHREHRYPEWRALAERNPLGEGTRIEGETSPEDADTFAVAPRSPAERPELVAAIPAPDLALTLQRWLPDAVDLAPPAGQDRERFEEAGAGTAGQPVVVRLAPAPAAGAPAIVRLRALAGEGRYELLALGAASGALVRARVEALARDGRAAAALELAAAWASAVPGAASRAEVLAAAGRVAGQAAPALAPAAVGAFDAAARALGAPIFQAVDGKVRYTGAFEALAQGPGGR